MSSTDLTDEANASTYRAIQAQIDVIDGLRQQVEDLSKKHDSIIENFNRNRRSRRHSCYNQPPPVPPLETIPGSPTEPTEPGSSSARLQTPEVPPPPLPPPPQPPVSFPKRRNRTLPPLAPALTYRPFSSKEDPFHPQLKTMAKDVITAYFQRFTSKKVTVFDEAPSVRITPRRQRRMDIIRKLCHKTTSEERSKLSPRSCGSCTNCKANRAVKLAKKKARGDARRRRRLRVKKARGLNLTIEELLDLTVDTDPAYWLRLRLFRSKEAPEKMSLGVSKEEARSLRCIIEGAPPMPPPSPVEGKLAKGPFCCQLGPIIPVIMPAIKPRAKSASPDLARYTVEKEGTRLKDAESRAIDDEASPQSEASVTIRSQEGDFRMHILVDNELKETCKRYILNGNDMESEGRRSTLHGKGLDEQQRGRAGAGPKLIHRTPEKVPTLERATAPKKAPVLEKALAPKKPSAPKNAPIREKARATEKANTDSPSDHSSRVTSTEGDDGKTVKNGPRKGLNLPPLPSLPPLPPVPSLKNVTDSTILQRRVTTPSRVSEGKVSKAKQKEGLDAGDDSDSSRPKESRKGQFERVLKELEDAAYAYAIIENDANLTNIRNAQSSKAAEDQSQCSDQSGFKFSTPPLEGSTDFTFAIACKCVGMLRIACEDLKLARNERKSKQDKVDAFVSDQTQLKIVKDLAVKIESPTRADHSLSRRKRNKEKAQKRKVTNEQFLATAVVPFLELGYKLDIVKVYASSAPTRAALVRQFYIRHDNWITGRGLESKPCDTGFLDNGVDLLKSAYKSDQKNPLEALNDAIISMERYNWITDQGQSVESGSDLDLLRIAIRQQQKDRYDALNDAVVAMNMVEEQEMMILKMIASMRLRLRYVLSVYSTNTLIKSLPEPTKAKLLKEEKRILSLGHAPAPAPARGVAGPSSSKATKSSSAPSDGDKPLHATFNVWSGDGLTVPTDKHSNEKTDVRETWWYRQALAQRRFDREVWQKLANSTRAKEENARFTAKGLAAPAPSKGKRGKKKKALDLPLCAKIIEVDDEDSIGQTDLEGLDLADAEEIMRRLLRL